MTAWTNAAHVSLFFLAVQTAVTGKRPTINPVRRILDGLGSMKDISGVNVEESDESQVPARGGD